MRQRAFFPPRAARVRVRALARACGLLRRVVRLAVVLVVRVVSFHVPYRPAASACFAMGVAVGVRLAGWLCYMHPSHAGCCPPCGKKRPQQAAQCGAVVGDDTGCFFLLFVSGCEGATS